MDNNKDNGSVLSNARINELYIANTFTEASDGEINFSRDIEREVLAAQAEQSQPPVPRVGGNTSLEGLTKYWWAHSGMDVVSSDSFGGYYRADDVQKRLAGSPVAHLASQSQAAQPTILRDSDIVSIAEHACLNASRLSTVFDFARAIERTVTHLAGQSQVEEQPRAQAKLAGGEIGSVEDINRIWTAMPASLCNEPFVKSLYRSAIAGAIVADSARQSQATKAQAEPVGHVVTWNKGGSGEVNSIEPIGKSGYSLAASLPEGTLIYIDAPVAKEAPAVPDILFDGFAVYAELTRHLGKQHCFSPDAVSATLDAVVRLIRRGASVAKAETGVQAAVGTLQEQFEEALANVLCEHTKLNEDGLDEYVPRIIGLLPADALSFEVVPSEGTDPAHYEPLTDNLEFAPDKHHQIADMANVGYSLMQMIKAHRPSYCWNESPAEIVSDLINELEETRSDLAPTTSTDTDGSAA